MPPKSSTKRKQAEGISSDDEAPVPQVTEKKTKKEKPPQEIPAGFEFDIPDCDKHTQKKYLTRGSPAYPAQECGNMIVSGNDGRAYKAMKNKDGGFAWKPYKFPVSTSDDDDDEEVAVAKPKKAAAPAVKEKADYEIPADFEFDEPPCEKETAAKYLKRPSPAYPAQLCEGLIMPGNFGGAFESRPDKDGKCSWKKYRFD